MATNTQSTDSAKHASRSLSTPAKLTIGALGGLAPLMASLVLADSTTVATALESFSTGDRFELAGYVVRILTLTALGAFWAYLHRTEYEPFKVFQLGVVAPAMITGVINAANVERARDPAPEPVATISFSLIPEAYAGDHDDRPKKPSGAEKFIKGFLGRP